MAKEAHTVIHIQIYRKLLLKNRIEFVLLLLLHTCIGTHWNNYAAFTIVYNKFRGRGGVCVRGKK